MPKVFKTTQERRKYFRDWFQTDKGFASRKKTIVQRAVANRRCPTQHILAKYKVEGPDLEHILEAIRTCPEESDIN